MKNKSYIKNWNQARGFGFLTSEIASNDIFLHVSELKGITVEADTYIEFACKTTSKGTSAIDVVDFTNEKRDAIAKEKAERAIIEKEWSTFEASLIAKYKPLLDALPKATTPNDTLKNVIKARRFKKEAEAEFIKKYPYDSFYDAENLDYLFILQEDKMDEVRECNRCNEWFSKAEINANYSSLLLYKCNGCVPKHYAEMEVLKAKKKKEMEVTDLTTITTKGGLKQLVSTILSNYIGFCGEDMDEKSQQVLDVIISNGSYQTGYFAPGSGIKKGSSCHGWKSTGSGLRKIVTWRSPKGNFCKDSERFRVMGSIDDNYSIMLEQLHSL